MRAHLSNAAYGVFDYAAHPVGMLLVAPVLLHHLGVAQYGVWVVATAAVSAGSIIASGFGDANIQYIASIRSRGDSAVLQRAVRSMMGINLLLGTSLALISWMLIPLLVRHVAPSDISLQITCLWSLRIASLLMLVRAIESVCISTQRAFERYGPAVRISILARLLTLAVAVLLTYGGFGVISIMVTTAVLMVMGTIAQLASLKQHLSATSLLPSFDRAATAVLFGFGIFSWLQAVSGVIFSQSDRLILGVSLGATSVTAYALCVQMAQPIYGIAASGLHFLFPYLSGRQATTPLPLLKRTILIAFTINLLLVSAETVAALLLGRPVLRIWVGEEIAQSASAVLAPIVWSFALLGLNVTGYYTMLALGHVRVVTWFNIAGGAAMLLMMVLLLPHMGINGVAMARLFYGLSALFIYFPLIRLLLAKHSERLPASGAYPICGDV
jgi:O-antigen/teichoic acid export membrane protein